MPKIYSFSPPALNSSGVYYFTTDKEVEYEVRFGRKQADILQANIVFGVINDEYDGEEYTLVNKGEFYSVINTICAIIRDFLMRNPNIHGFEFSGEPLDQNTIVKRVTKRTRVYLRYARKIFPEDSWHIHIDGNKVLIDRKR